MLDRVLDRVRRAPVLVVVLYVVHGHGLLQLLALGQHGLLAGLAAGGGAHLGRGVGERETGEEEGRGKEGRGEGEM